MTQGGSRPHVIFARNEVCARIYGNWGLKIFAQVRITVFDDGLEGKDLPTGFNADVEGEL